MHILNYVEMLNLVYYISFTFARRDATSYTFINTYTLLTKKLAFEK